MLTMKVMDGIKSRNLFMAGINYFYGITASVKISVPRLYLDDYVNEFSLIRWYGST